jgi:hypothetical protein
MELISRGINLSACVGSGFVQRKAEQAGAGLTPGPTLDQWLGRCTGVFILSDSGVRTFPRWAAASREGTSAQGKPPVDIRKQN